MIVEVLQKPCSFIMLPEPADERAVDGGVPALTERKHTWVMSLTLCCRKDSPPGWSRLPRSFSLHDRRRWLADYLDPRRENFAKS